LPRRTKREAVIRGAGRDGRRRHGVFLAGWALLAVAAISCTRTFEEVGFPEPRPGVFQEQETPSLSEREFRFALLKLENGDFQGARETLSEIVGREDDPTVAPEVSFSLGVLDLLEAESHERLKACRDYFQAYAAQYPRGPYRDHADRIVRILTLQIHRAEAEQRRIEELTQRVSDQEKVIQTLEFKIEKLEEIHRETEQKRHLPEGG
jgi:hypothetical protein